MSKKAYQQQLSELLQHAPLWQYGHSLPSPRQALFLTLPHKEVLFGGAAAGGKSFALMLDSLLFVDRPEYNAILFRQTFQDLALPGALIDLSKQMLMGTDAKWNGSEHFWLFPSGATINFGYLKSADDKYRYQSTEFHYIAFDELTQFKQDDYTYLFTRLRKQEGSDIPLRMRAASNPGGVGHEWVFERFLPIDKEMLEHVLRQPLERRYYEKEGRAFIPAFIADNPHIDVSYYDSLDQADPVTRAQLLNGDWYIQPTGGVFDRQWFTHYYSKLNPLGFDAEAKPIEFDEMLISVDMAYKEHDAADYTVLQCWGRKRADYYLIDQVRGRWGFPEAKRRFLQFCDKHPNAYHKVIEDKAAGISLIQELKREVGGLVPYNPGTKSKVERAQIIAPYWEAGNVYLPEHERWVADFINECVSFPTNPHDDQVDAMSQALVKFQKAKKHYYIGQV